MTIAVEPTDLDAIRPMREVYRSEMRCQIIHDSVHRRAGWTQEYAVRRGGTLAGYGSVAIAGPWAEKAAVYEMFVRPDHRSHAFDLMEAFIAACKAPAISIQTNDLFGTVMLHMFARDLANEAILFGDGITTNHAPPNARFRNATADEASDAAPQDLQWRGVIEVDGEVAATGGVLFHYNPPYGDIYMHVDARFRRRGLGTFMVQELKRLCYERGHIPAARCNPDNVASRQTLQRAGLVPCGFMVGGRLP
jgi:GNAT superfamily N-acetyltransferase